MCRQARDGRGVERAGVDPEPLKLEQLLVEKDELLVDGTHRRLGGGVGSDPLIGQAAMIKGDDIFGHGPGPRREITKDIR